MRLLLRFRIPAHKGNQAAADGSLASTIEQLVKQVSPEAAYFHLDDGCRAGTLVFEETDQTNMAAICEPMFAALEAEIDIQPAVSINELVAKL